MKIKNYFQLIFALFCPITLNAQWTTVNSSPYIFLYKVQTISADTAFAFGAENNVVNPNYFILKTNTSGATWDSISLNTIADKYQFQDIFFLNANEGFVSGRKNNNMVLLKTIDNGNTWNDITPSNIQSTLMSKIHFLDALNGFITIHHPWSTSVYKTFNGGASWTLITKPILNVYDLYFIDMNTGFSVGCNNNWSVGSEITKTTDGGQTWTGILANATALNYIHPNILFTPILTSFTNSTYTNKILRTKDAGSTWDTITVTPAADIYSCDFTSIDTGHVFTSTGEIYATFDGGQNWTLEDAPIIPVDYYSLSFKGEHGYIAGNGIIKKHTSATGTKDDKSSKKINIYPNPIHASDNLYIDVSELTGNCTVKIVNTLGQTVLQKNINNIGNNSTLTLSDIHLQAGIYYITLGTKENRSTEKLMIIK